MPKKPTRPKTAEELDGRELAANIDSWLHKHAETFWDNFINFRALSKENDLKYYTGMRDYYGAGCSIVGYLRSQLAQNKGEFSNGRRETSEGSSGIPRTWTAPDYGENAPETD